MTRCPESSCPSTSATSTPRSTFYSRLFGVVPAKLRPGYANFAVDDPPLKLVLNSPGNGPGGTINHLGVEVGSTGDVIEAEARLAAAGLAVEPGRARSAATPGRTRCGRMTRTGCRGSTTPSWSTSRRHDRAAARGRPCHCQRRSRAGAGSAEWLRLARLARLLSWLTLAWMGVEGGVAIGAAIAAGSVALLGFGLDSGIEAIASIIVIWRFTGTRLASATPSGAPSSSSRSASTSSPPTSPPRRSGPWCRRPRRDQRRRPGPHRRNGDLRARPRDGQATHRRPPRLTGHRRAKAPRTCCALTWPWPCSPGWPPTRCSAPGGWTASSHSHRRLGGHRRTASLGRPVMQLRNRTRRSWRAVAGVGGSGPGRWL